MLKRIVCVKKTGGSNDRIILVQPPIILLRLSSFIFDFLGTLASFASGFVGGAFAGSLGRMSGFFSRVPGRATGIFGGVLGSVTRILHVLLGTLWVRGKRETGYRQSYSQSEEIHTKAHGSSLCSRYTASSGIVANRTKQQV
jgi:hypothetical protein